MKTPMPDQVFEVATAGRRVRVVTGLCLGLTIAAEIFVGVIFFRDHKVPMAVRLIVLPLITTLGPAIVGGIWYGARLKSFTISDGALLVKRAFHTPRFELAGLKSAETSREPMKWASKIYGNDGLGAIAGSYRSKQWGKFKAYLTDANNAVVLRWADDRCVIVSPKHTQPFIHALRKYMD